jgi:beta-N-acetylhexosaminidase
VRAAKAGFDLLLLLHDEALEELAVTAVVDAAEGGELSPESVAASARRVFALRRWLATAAGRRPGLEVVGSAGHRALAREIAERSMTLVRDRQRLLPLRTDPGRVLVLAPRPTDLTPADTSSYLRFGLAEALAVHGLSAESREIPLDPDASGVAGLRALAGDRIVVVATIDATAHRGQADLVRALVADGRSVVAVALRTPFDLDAYPEVGTYVCAYGLQPPTVEALAGAVLGRIPFVGRLPVRLATEAVAA